MERLGSLILLLAVCVDLLLLLPPLDTEGVFVALAFLLGGAPIWNFPRPPFVLLILGIVLPISAIEFDLW